MIPVFCHEKHNPSEGKYGDCLRACVASLLEFENIEDVPHFFRDGRDGQTAHNELKSWAKSQGYYPFSTAFSGVESVENVCEAMAAANPDIYYLLYGSTDSGEGHVVIKLNNETAHNPSWGGTRVTKPNKDNLWIVTVFVPMVLVDDRSKT